MALPAPVIKPTGALSSFSLCSFPPIHPALSSGAETCLSNFFIKGSPMEATTQTKPSLKDELQYEHEQEGRTVSEWLMHALLLGYLTVAEALCDEFQLDKCEASPLTQRNRVAAAAYGEDGYAWVSSLSLCDSS